MTVGAEVVEPDIPAFPLPLDDAARHVLGFGVLKQVPRQSSAFIKSVGKWVNRNESMSEAARAYQRFISRRQDDMVFEVGGYTFDNFDEVRGVLQDAKAIPEDFVDPATGLFKPWVSGTDEWLKQAENQVKAASGAPIEWYFSSKAAKDAMYNLFQEKNPDLLKSIELIDKAMQ